MPEPGFSDVKYFRHRAHTLCMGLFFRLDEYVEDFPTGTPQRLIDVIKKIVVEIDAVVDRVDDDRLLKGICSIIAALSSAALDYLDNAHTAQAPRGLVQMLERLRGKIYPKSVLLVAPQVEYNYTIWDLLPALKNLTKQLPDAKTWDTLFSPFEGPINVVCFPRIERENILLHAIFGHEFGHPIADEFLDQHEKEPAYKTQLSAAREEIRKRFAQHLSAHPDPMDRLDMEIRLFDELVHVYRRALQELISDAVGILLFGPSALFAAIDVLVPGGLDDLPASPESYPPTRYRLRCMREVLRQDNQLDRLKAIAYGEQLGPVGVAVRQFIQYIEALTDANDDLQRLKGNDLFDVAYNWVAKSLPSALDFAKTSLRDHCFIAGLIDSHLHGALERLHLEVPPGEIGTYPNLSLIDWRLALLAGWLYKIYLASQAIRPWSDRQRKPDPTQRLTLKGIEDCLLREEYAVFLSSNADKSK